MTFVAAKQFGERILIAADTMISQPNQARHDLIPGALKIITLDPKLTIAFAGLRDQAVDAVKRAKEMLGDEAPIAAIEQMLARTTHDYYGNIEFLIVSHRDEATLKRVWDGQVSAPLAEACIGQRDLLPRFNKAVAEAPQMIVPMWFEAESPFSRGFDELFDGIHVAEGVGGFGISAVGTPSGHYYAPKGGVACWDVIRGGQPLSEEQLADRRSGKTEWGYATVGSALRGVAVVGVIVINSGIGYIYAPFLEDRPIPWPFERPATQEQQVPILERFQRAVGEYAVMNGGGVEPTIFPERSEPPTEADMQAAQAHAARASMPTTITLNADAIYLRCGTAIFNQGVRIDFAALESDAKWTLTETIDRLNAAVVSAHHRAAENQARWEAEEAEREAIGQP